MKTADMKRAYQRGWYRDNRDKRIAQVRARKQRIATWFRAYKRDLSCEVCGEDHPAALDFHHKDGNSKEGVVSKLVTQGASQERILREIAKCIVLCSNCHRKLHSELGDTFTLEQAVACIWQLVKGADGEAESPPRLVMNSGTNGRFPDVSGK